MQTTEIRADLVLPGDVILTGPRRGTRSKRRVLGVEAIDRGPVRPGGGRMVALDVGDAFGPLAVTADAKVEVVA